ncbi:unnamed protein product [Allacma fusca]|uniref:Uncharacterized protein n=1 Tax=Allacma fusca TaxID=39272 RepID=A0A8J2JMU2_9HEXA|nr:unnamed protein product [Allacma fusca]
MPSPGVEPEVKAEPAESTNEEGFENHFEDFTKDVEVGGQMKKELIDAGGMEKTTKKKKIRPRKRKLYTDVCQQIEFYFSDSNISKNRMMLELVAGSEYVSLDHFLGFHKIQKLLPDVSIAYLQKSLASSSVLELSPDLLGVKRRVSYDPQKLKSDEEVEQCTIYVENVPTHVDHEWLEKIFQEFGPIAYVAMPKFKHSGLPKGFAFIEFKEKEGAEHCLNAYGDIGACLPKDLDPEKLLSVRTFERPESSTSPNGVTDISTSPSSSHQKRERSEDVVDGDDDVPKKRRRTDSAEAQSPSRLPDSTATEDKGENGESNAQSSAEKKKRRRLYKTKKLDNIEKLESDSIQLKILPKKIWRQLRNRYLNLQRENLGKLKRQLRIQNRPPRNDSRQQPDQTKSEEEGIVTAKNVIAKIEFQEPYENSETLKNRLLTDVMPKDNSSALLFVDYDNPNKYAYVRLDGNSDHFEEVGEFLRNASSIFGSAAVLNDVQTQEFWNEVRLKIKTDSKKKVRGRDKLLQQAMKTATHIRFADED